MLHKEKYLITNKCICKNPYLSTYLKVSIDRYHTYCVLQNPKIEASHTLYTHAWFMRILHRISSAGTTATQGDPKTTRNVDPKVPQCRFWVADICIPHFLLIALARAAPSAVVAGKLIEHVRRH